MNQQTQWYYEFGPFRLIPGEYQLVRAGERVPLPPKAFETLLVLVENHGHILEKDELLKRIWPDTFVEEVSLSKNIWALRKAMGDEEAGRSYIETVPRRGYRFVAKVREVGLAPGNIAVDDNLLPLPQAESPKAAPPAMSPPAPARTRPWRRRTVLIPFGLLVALCVWGGWFVISRKTTQTSTAPVRITPLTSFAGSESQPAFSPDGKQIAFVWNGVKEDNYDIYVKLIGTEIPHRLTTNSAPETSPAWSPDGRYVAFLRESSEDCGVYLVPALGGPERKVTRINHHKFTPGNPKRIAWSPDGVFLAVSDTSSSGEPLSISLVSVETGERRKLTSPPAGYSGDRNPAFSPDSKIVAFTRSYGLKFHMDLFLVSVSGGEPKQLAKNHAYLNGVAWSSDGREVFFSSSSKGSIHNASLWKVSATGGIPEPVPGVGQNAFSLAIDRREGRLAYEQRIYDTNIYQIDISNPAEGSAPPTKLISSTFQDDSPSYSPDGKRIAFISDRTGNLEVWSCDSNGANPIPMTDFGGAHTGSPRWSPDGRQLAFDSHINDTQEIFVMSADGGKPRRLVTNPVYEMIPSWSQDGRWIYFTSKRSGDWQIWKARAEGGEAVQVTREGGVEAFESADGKYIYYTKAMGLGDLWRVPVEGGNEIFILPLQKSGHFRSWAIAADGIYFAVAETPSRSVIDFYRFASGQVERQGARLDRSLKCGPPALAISRDGRRLLYTRIDQSGSDIILMENFR